MKRDYPKARHRILSPGPELSQGKKRPSRWKKETEFLL